MPYSAGENADYIAALLEFRQPKRLIDIGPGAGYYGKIARQHGVANITAIEIFPNYVDEFNLNSIYDNVIVDDVRNIETFDADMVIAGDVLEHMTEGDMVEVVDRIREQVEWLVISVPIVHYPQGHSHGNEHEAHLQEDLNLDVLSDIFGSPYDYKEFDVTGTFIYRGQYL